ncbi:MAG: fibronectin type III domain-containing protein, partial [Candidatus Woesearchaeota archaeon]
VGNVDDNSTVINPTRQGDNVIFTANATDNEGDMYRLIVCTTNSTINGECSSGSEICSSYFVSSGTQASCSHNTSLETNYNYSWYAFVCDAFSACSESNYANSPYYINRKPIAYDVDISPRPATTSDDLVGSYSYFDADDDEEGNSIFAWYINGTKVKEGYVSEGVFLNTSEFGLGDRIILEITPCDNSGFCGDANASSVLFIGNSPPGKVNLTSPINGDTTVHDRNTTFTWEEAYDADNDPLTYHLQLSNSSDFDYLIVNASGISGLSYTLQVYLDLNKVYYWRVRAFDSQDYGEFSDVWNFSIEPVLNITLISNATDFGTISNNQENDTTDDVPEPFVVRNYGNYEVNISVNATPLWQSVSLGTEYFKFKAGIYQGVLSFDYENSQTDWAYFTQEPQSIIKRLNYKYGNNSARIDIYIKVPAQEGAGYRSSIIEVSNG